MTPQFASSELNHLLKRELAEGSYGSFEEALLAGLKALRELRDFQVKLHTTGGDGLQPDVDLSRNVALSDLMDEHNGSI
jgi:hypothetical protein